MLTWFFESENNFSSLMVRGMKDSVMPGPLSGWGPLRSHLYKLKKPTSKRVRGVGRERHSGKWHKHRLALELYVESSFQRF